MLPSYCYMQNLVNPSMFTHIEIENKLKYFFTTLGASIRRFTYIRKIIGINASLIKTKLKGALVVASIQDSKYYSYLIVWHLLDRENNVAWTWHRVYPMALS